MQAANGGMGEALARVSAVALAAWLLWGCVPRAVAEPAHHPANFSLLYPISTNRDPDVTTNFRLSLLYGRAGAVRGLDLNGGVSVLGREFRGVQLTGLYSEVGGDFGGAALTGGVNYLAQNGRGIQVAGLVNFDRGTFRGLQYAQIFNYTQQGFSGAQVTAVFNLNDGDGKYLQLSSIANVTAGSFRGAQLGGGFNYTNRHLSGVQVGLLNLADTFGGLQVGLVNFSRRASGVQIGVFNWVGQHESVPIGMVNLAQNGHSDWVTFGSTLAAVSTGWRTRIKGWTSTLAVGGVDLDQEQEDTAFLSWHYGRDFPVASTWDVHGDVGYLHIIPQPNDDPTVNDRLHYAVQARVLAEWQASQTLSVFAGGGASVIFSEYTSTASSKTDPLAVLGVSLY